MAFYEGNNQIALTTPQKADYSAPAGDGPQPNVVYVNQFGQPVAPPQQQQPQIRYVDQYGRPIAGPTAQPAVYPTHQTQTSSGPAPNPYYDNMNETERSMRTCSTIFGFLALLSIIVAIIVDELSEGDIDDTSVGFIAFGEWNCGFTQVNAEFIGISVQEWGYDELCHEGPDDGIAIPEACDAKTGGILAMVFAIGAALFVIVGMIYVQPKTEVKRGTSFCPRIIFVIALILCILSPIIWQSMGESLCINGDYWRLGIGNSIYILIAADVWIFVALLLAK